ncbi:MAG: hypothetical protein Q4A50_10470 [Bacteroidales bacterium]|nr:hypothetical protein [Bacteroidales bacterium]
MILFIFIMTASVWLVVMNVLIVLMADSLFSCRHRIYAWGGSFVFR